MSLFCDRSLYVGVGNGDWSILYQSRIEANTPCKIFEIIPIESAALQGQIEE